MPNGRPRLQLELVQRNGYGDFQHESEHEEPDGEHARRDAQFGHRRVVLVDLAQGVRREARDDHSHPLLAVAAGLSGEAPDDRGDPVPPRPDGAPTRPRGRVPSRRCLRRR